MSERSLNPQLFTGLLQLLHMQICTARTCCHMHATTEAAVTWQIARAGQRGSHARSTKAAGTS